MSNSWVTSDTHFWHKNVIPYCNRPFSSVEEMNDVMIQRWNEKVQPNDTVYHLGDFFLTNDRKLIDLILPKLNGKLILVKGNHDKWIKRYPDVESYIYLKRTFTIGEKKIPVVMMHYPILSWEEQHYGSVMLHGHSHNRPEVFPQKMRKNVGVDLNNFYPHNMTDLLKTIVSQ